MTTATVELLTAEVRTLVVGNRQVTQSMFRQLDIAKPEDVEPLGRVRDPKVEGGVYVAGRHRQTGALVRSHITAPPTGVTTAAPDDLPRALFRLAEERGYGPRWPRTVGYDRDAITVGKDGRLELRWYLGGMHAGIEHPRWDDDPTLPPRTVMWASPEVEAQARQEVDSYLRDMSEDHDRWATWYDLPLVVLAGLR